MYTQMSFEEMMKRAEDGTLSKAMLRDYSLGLGTRFKIMNVFEDIKQGIEDMKSEKKLKKIKYVHISELVDDESFLGIKFKNDKSKEKYTILVEPREFFKLYKVIDTRNKEENPGLIGGILKLKRRKKLYNSLIEVILENEQ